MMTVPSQLEAVQLGTNVSLRCKSEAFPASINYWVRGAGETVSSGPRLRTSSVVQDHVTHMRLDITAATAADIQTYRCVARNSLGETDGRIKLYGEAADTLTSSTLTACCSAAGARGRGWRGRPDPGEAAADDAPHAEAAPHPHLGRGQHQAQRPRGHAVAR